MNVLELATGVAGPYAGRLLAMLGAEVTKVEPAGGDVSRRMVVDDSGAEPGAVFAWLNAGKALADQTDLDRLVAEADVVIDDRVRPELVAQGKTVVTITPWGDGPGRPEDELAVQAASGVLRATDGWRLPGWQSQYLAGGYAVAAALVALRRPGGHQIETTWAGAVLTAAEATVATQLHGDDQRGFHIGAFPAGVFACADGYVIPGTVRAVDWRLQCEIYDRPDLLDDDRFTVRHRWANRDALRAEIQPWYDAHTKREIFATALDRSWAAAMVMTASDALADPHLRARGFLTDDDDDPIPRLPAFAGLLGAVSHARASVSAPKTGRLRVLELTWAWAGPFVGRFLGAYGADVVRIETGAHPDGWRTRLRWRDLDDNATPPPGADPDGYTWDAAALHNSLNRNKRSLSVDLTTPAGQQLFVDLLATIDVLVVNMAAGMLADRGLQDAVDEAVDRHHLVVVTMPALGATGPYKDLPGYGILMEGMGGFAARFGDPAEGAATTDTYYPDLVAGIHGTIAALAGLASRDATGKGRAIDLSQQELTWLQLAEGLVHFARTGREPQRMGNAEPGHPEITTPAINDDIDPDMVERLTHPVTGDRAYLAMPVRIDGEHWQSTRPAPTFGEHTDDVLREWLGLDQTTIDRLRADRAIGTRPQRR